MKALSSWKDAKFQPPRTEMSQGFGQKIGGLLTVASICSAGSNAAWARKTNQAIYEDPFDIGAGGASLTRASKEGRVFANPALLPYGGTFHRWLGATFTLLTNRESVETVRSMVNGGDSTSSEDGADGEDENTEFVDQAFENPIRAGWGIALSWVTNNFGFSIFSRFEPDIRARKIGSTGVPEIQFQAESYHGAALGLALRTPVRWFSVGLTGKYIMASEPNIAVEVTDQEQIAEFRDPGFARDFTSHNAGGGADLGLLFFFQGSWLDFSLAGKVDDIGNTKLSGPSDSPKEFKQVLSAGTGITFHTSTDALHLAVDYRDIQGTYEEEKFKRFYAGTKLLLRKYIGLAAGYYNGYPSYAAEIDLLAMRVAATSYTRELGDNPGVDPRRIYMGSLSFGF